MPYSWTCPFCDRATTIVAANESYETHSFNLDNLRGRQVRLITHAVVCPHPDCREIALTAGLHDTHPHTGQTVVPPWIHWALRPTGTSRTFPDYIPAPLLTDYTEACAIRELSPKASATLSRRCLQGMIRDFWSVSRPRLVDEIRAIEDRVDPSTWLAIDAVRSIGNIGAHMEADINVIVDVDPDEARMLIGLIESLFEDWYIARETRAQRNASLVAMAAAKKAQQAGDPASA